MTHSICWFEFVGLLFELVTMFGDNVGLLLNVLDGIFVGKMEGISVGCYIFIYFIFFSKRLMKRSQLDFQTSL